MVNVLVECQGRVVLKPQDQRGNGIRAVRHDQRVQRAHYFLSRTGSSGEDSWVSTGQYREVGSIINFDYRPRNKDCR